MAPHFADFDIFVDEFIEQQENENTKRKTEQNHRDMTWGDVKLHKTVSGEEYLEYNEKQTVARIQSRRTTCYAGAVFERNEKWWEYKYINKHSQAVSNTIYNKCG